MSDAAGDIYPLYAEGKRASLVGLSAITTATRQGNRAAMRSGLLSGASERSAAATELSSVASVAEPSCCLPRMSSDTSAPPARLSHQRDSLPAAIVTVCPLSA